MAEVLSASAEEADTHRVAETAVIADNRFSVIRKRDIIRAAPAAFERQYGGSREGASWKASATRGEMIDALNALDVETCAADAVNEIIGNRSWTENKCDACGVDAEVLIRSGDGPDLEARWQDLCASCLADAAALATTSASSSSVGNREAIEPKPPAPSSNSPGTAEVGS